VRFVEEKWTLRYQAGTQRLFIIAEGYATEEKSAAAAVEFKKLLGSNTVDVIVDLDKMTGYTTGARRTWQECFGPVKKQLRRLVVVGTQVPAMVRMGATVVAAVVGIPVSFYKTIDELNDVGRRSAG
jgi:hypothetical protein